MPRTTVPVRAPGTLLGVAQPTLHVGELTLRPWTANDVRALVQAYIDPAIRRWHARTMTVAEAEDYVSAANRDWPSEIRATWAVTEDDLLVGRTSVKYDLHEGLASVGFWVVPAARGRGVAPRALAAVAGWGTTDLGLHRFELEHSTRNEPSCRVAAKAGFHLEGTRRRVALHDDGWHDMHVHVVFGGNPTA